MLCKLAGPARVTSHSIKGESEANGDAFAGDGPMVSRGTDAGFAESTASEASKSAALLTNIQSMLGCTMEEVLNTWYSLLRQEGSVSSVLLAQFIVAT